MSITVSAVKARQNLGELLNLVSIKHEEVIIERAGKKIARLISIEETDTVNEPVAEEYTVQKKSAKKGKIDFSEFFGTWDEEEYRKVTEVINEIRQARKSGQKPALQDIPEGSVPEHPDILDLCGLGKEMWESTGLTPDEYIRKEREEWN